MKVKLSDVWTLSVTDPENGTNLELPAQVPGNVLGDLVRAGRMSDPYFRNQFAEFPRMGIFRLELPHRVYRAGF